MWTADGKWFVFQSSKDGNTDLWKLPGDDTSRPVRVTDGPLQPGSYRVTLKTGLTNRVGNPLSAPYVRTFTAAGGAP